MQSAIAQVGNDARLKRDSFFFLCLYFKQFNDTACIFFLPLAHQCIMRASDLFSVRASAVFRLLALHSPTVARQLTSLHRLLAAFLNLDAEKIGPGAANGHALPAPSQMLKAWLYGSPEFVYERKAKAPGYATRQQDPERERITWLPAPYSQRPCSALHQRVPRRYPWTTDIVRD